jgi:hypothetical protein
VLETQAKVVTTDHDMQAGITVTMTDMWPMAPVLAGDTLVMVLETMHVMIAMRMPVVAMALAVGKLAMAPVLMLEGMAPVVALHMTRLMTTVMPVGLMAAIVATFIAMTFAIGHRRVGQADAEQRGEGQADCQFTVVHKTPPVLRPGLSRPWCPR